MIAVYGEAEFLDDAMRRSSIKYQEGDHAGTGYGCRKIVIFSPSYAEAWHLLGLLACQSEEPSRGCDFIARAIIVNNRNIDYCYSHAVHLYRQRRVQESLASWFDCVRLAPDRPELMAALAIVLTMDDRPAESISYCLYAICLVPDLCDAYLGMAVALDALERQKDALPSWQRLTMFLPDNTTAHSRIVSITGEYGTDRQTIDACRRAITIAPDIAEFYEKSGDCLFRENRLSDAFSAFYRNFYFGADEGESLHKLGYISQSLGRLVEARVFFCNSLALSPDSNVAFRDLAQSFLRDNDFEKGFYLLDRSTQNSVILNDGLKNQEKSWNGEGGYGRTLLIYSDWSLSETIQLASYVSFAALRGWRIILAVYPNLVRLMGLMKNIAQVVSIDEILPDFDCHCAMSRLPWIFRASFDQIPAMTNCFNPEEAALSSWRDRLNFVHGSDPKIGILATAEMEDSNYFRRSIRPETLLPLFRADDSKFMALEKETKLPIIDFTSEINDLADMAALLTNLNLVIAVDSPITHLAAALGKPVWLLSHFEPDWHWMAGNEASIWYSSLRIFRQSKFGDWSGVVERVCEELGDLVW